MSREDLAKMIFEAMQAKAKEITPDFQDSTWGDDSREAEIGRECFRAGADAVLARVAELN
jgi:hypothetical protein